MTGKRDSLDPQKAASYYNLPGAPPEAAPDDLAGHIVSTGVGVTAGELRAVEALGEQLGELLGTEPIARNALMRHAIRKFILDVRAGRITLADLAQEFAAPPKPKARYRPRK